MSGGRLSLGVAVGWRDEEFEAFGVDKSERAGRAVERIQLLRELLSDRPVTYDGTLYAVEDLRDHAEDRFIVGGPETGIEEFNRYQERLDIDNLILRMHFPGLDPSHSAKSIRLIAEKVMPHLE